MVIPEHPHQNAMTGTDIGTRFTSIPKAQRRLQQAGILLAERNPSALIQHEFPAGCSLSRQAAIGRLCCKSRPGRDTRALSSESDLYAATSSLSPKSSAQNTAFNLRRVLFCRRTAADFFKRIDQKQPLIASYFGSMNCYLV